MRRQLEADGRGTSHGDRPGEGPLPNDHGISSAIFPYSVCVMRGTSMIMGKEFNPYCVRRLCPTAAVILVFITGHPFITK